VIRTTEASLLTPRAFALVALAIAAACASPSTRIGRLYESLQADVSAQSSNGVPDMNIAERHASRAAEVHQMLDKGEITTPKARFQASVILVESGDPDDWKLAEDLAQQAATEGEPLAPRVGAEAIDKQRVFTHAPQRYGTQYEWIAALGEWRVYLLDPTTTDAERKAVGVPSLAEIYAIEKRLNAKKVKPEPFPVQ
jgi:hypothetical protein